jgi:hypothetical protein
VNDVASNAEYVLASIYHDNMGEKSIFSTLLNGEAKNDNEGLFRMWKINCNASVIHFLKMELNFASTSTFLEFPIDWLFYDKKALFEALDVYLKK